jgi:hypothetical protein
MGHLYIWCCELLLMAVKMFRMDRYIPSRRAETTNRLERIVPGTSVREEERNGRFLFMGYFIDVLWSRVAVLEKEEEV